MTAINLASHWPCSILLPLSQTHTHTYTHTHTHTVVSPQFQRTLHWIIFISRKVSPALNITTVFYYEIYLFSLCGLVLLLGKEASPHNTSDLDHTHSAGSMRKSTIGTVVVGGANILTHSHPHTAFKKPERKHTPRQTHMWAESVKTGVRGCLWGATVSVEKWRDPQMGRACASVNVCLRVEPRLQSFHSGVRGAKCVCECVCRPIGWEWSQLQEMDWHGRPRQGFWGEDERVPSHTETLSLSLSFSFSPAALFLFASGCTLYHRHLCITNTCTHVDTSMGYGQP